EIVLTHPPAANLAGLAANGIARGIFLERIQRAGKDLPFTLQTSLEAGDVLSVIGDETHIARLTKQSGYEKQQTEGSNLTSVASAIFIGALIGLPVLGIGGIEISLTIFVGVLLGGV